VENQCPCGHKIEDSAEIQGFFLRGFMDNPPCDLSIQIMITFYGNLEEWNINLCKHVFHNFTP